MAFTRRLVIFIASSKVTKEVYRRNVRRQQNALNTVCLVFFFSYWSTVVFFMIIDIDGHSNWTTLKWFYRPLPVGKPIPPGVPPLLHSSSSAWRSALLLSPDQSTHNLEDMVRAHSDHTITKPNMTDLSVIYCRRLLGSAQKLEEWHLKEKKVWICNLASGMSRWNDKYFFHANLPHCPSWPGPSLELCWHSGLQLCCTQGEKLDLLDQTQDDINLLLSPEISSCKFGFSQRESRLPHNLSHLSLCLMGGGGRNSQTPLFKKFKNSSAVLSKLNTNGGTECAVNSLR